MNDLRFSEVKTEEPAKETPAPAKPKFKFKIRRQNILIIAAGVLILAAFGTAVFFYMKTQNPASQNQAAAESDTQKLIAEVGKLLVLPVGEEPTVATISDVEKLKDQAFFANAKNGDKVLIYSKAGKAILYDPVAKKIVEVAPLNINN